MRKIQQGDVLFNKVKKLPDGVKKSKPVGGFYVFADGEVTGHAHRCSIGEGTLYAAEDGTLYFESKGASVTHEEHHTQTLEPGVWEIGRVVEVDPFENAVREVAD